MRRGPALVPVLATSIALAAGGVELPARTLERDGVVVTFPAVTVVSPAPSDDPIAVVCARLAGAATGQTVDADRDRLAVTEHRVVFHDPGDPSRILKVYRPDQYSPTQVAKLLQRDLGVQALLEARGVPVAPIDPSPALLARGVERQPFVVGKGLDALYPQGYRSGTNPAVDRVLATVTQIDRPLRSIVSMQSGLVFTNTVDCRTDQVLGVDLGHCYGNIFLETATGAPIFVDW